jgi:hypothetical protein
MCDSLRRNSLERTARLEVTLDDPQQETTMPLPRFAVPTIAGLVIAGLVLGGCTSNPNAPVNQSFPVRQMDQFFGSRPPPPPDYTRQPGYAPAYPPY